MAHKKAAGSADNLKDSKAKYRGVKLFGGQIAKAGNIIIRQKGSKYEVGSNTYVAKDFSIHASVDGVVKFSKKNKLRFDGRKYLKTYVSIENGVAVVASPKGEKPKAAKKPASQEKDAVAKKPTKPKAESAKKPAAKKTTATKKAVK